MDHRQKRTRLFKPTFDNVFKIPINIKHDKHYHNEKILFISNKQAKRLYKSVTKLTIEKYFKKKHCIDPSLNYCCKCVFKRGFENYILNFYTHV
jgi:hypothetical protein